MHLQRRKECLYYSGGLVPPVCADGRLRQQVGERNVPLSFSCPPGKNLPFKKTILFSQEGQRNAEGHIGVGVIKNM